MENRIRQGLEYLVRNKKLKEFVIFPYGTYGKKVQEIVREEYHIEERYVVDNFKRGDGIKTVEQLIEDYKKNKFMVLLAVDPLGWDTSFAVYKELKENIPEESIIDILSWSPYHAPWNHYESICAKNSKIALIECIAREVYKNDIEGAVAEAGVYKGETAKYINYLFPERKLYLFDTFEGFNSSDQENEDKKGLFNLKYDFSNTSEEIVLGKMRYPERIALYKGWFPESAKEIREQFAFVRLDMDLYNPIYAGLEYFYPRMTKGGYIVVHDCRSKNFEGAREAVIDFCKKEKLGYMCMPDRLGSAVINVGW